MSSLTYSVYWEHLPLACIQSCHRGISIGTGRPWEAHPEAEEEKDLYILLRSYAPTVLNWSLKALKACSLPKNLNVSTPPQALFSFPSLQLPERLAPMGSSGNDVQ